MKTSGYSGTPLAKKLGIKPGFSIIVINGPSHYFDLFSDFPENVTIEEKGEEQSLDFIHLFCQELEELERQFAILKPMLKMTGMLWVSWPKGSSKIPTDLKREPIREYILEHGLVDTKVCAVDKDWSGLKFVYRVKDRK